nr:hypothetical protein [uncultured Bacteroides sp.]
MKQLKFLMLAFTLLMGVSLTSCLSDNNGESAYDGYLVARTVYGSYFVDLAGNTYYPTTTSVLEMETKYGFKISSADLVEITFKYVDDTSAKSKATSTTPKKYNIQLVGAAAIDSYRAVAVNTVEEMEEETVENAPIMTLNPLNGYGQTTAPTLYGAEMLILPVQWKMENAVTALEQHTFSLVSVSEDKDATNSTLVFYLRHNKGTDTKSDAYAIRNKAYDIENILSDFKEENKNYPTRIIIKAKVNTSDITLPETYTEYTLDNLNLNK